MHLSVTGSSTGTSLGAHPSIGPIYHLMIKSVSCYHAGGSSLLVLTWCHLPQVSVQFHWMCRGKGSSGWDHWWWQWQAGLSCFCRDVVMAPVCFWKSLRAKYVSGVASALSHNWKEWHGTETGLASLFLSESYFTSFFYSLMSFCSTFNLLSWKAKKFLGWGSWTLRSWTSERQAYSMRSPASRKLFLDSSQENQKIGSHTPLLQIFIIHFPAFPHCCSSVPSVSCLSSCNTKELLTAAI